jgi:hypothetical protein
MPSDTSKSRTYSVAMKPEWNEVVVHCPICGEAVPLNVKVDDEHEYWGKAGYCHQVTATYTPDDGKLEVVAFYEPAR